MPKGSGEHNELMAQRARFAKRNATAESGLIGHQEPVKHQPYVPRNYAVQPGEIPRYTPVAHRFVKPDPKSDT